MTVKQVLNQIQESTLSEETTNNLIKYLYEDIITEYGGGYDYFVESYSSKIGRFEEQRDVEIIESLYSRRVYSPNSRIQKHELERLEGLLDICKNKLYPEVWKIIEGFMGKNLICFKDTNTVPSSKSHMESNHEDFDRIIIEGLVHQIKDDIDFLYENYEEEEVRRFENNSKLIQQLNKLLNVRGELFQEIHSTQSD